MVRSAQAEHPGRIVLVDTDDPVGTDWEALAGLGLGQVRWRGGAVWVPRLARCRGFCRSSVVPVVGRWWSRVGPVRWLRWWRGMVARYGVEHVVLLSRRGRVLRMWVGWWPVM